jgi:serine/threonine protein kinase
MMRDGDIFAGRYRLVRKLGLGGFSVVWLVADQLADDMEVALKIYAPERGMDEAGLKLFRKEYVLTAGMRHEGLLRATHFDVHDGSPYLVMPFCSKGSLATRLLDDGNMSERDLADALMQMSGALAYLHARDVMHGDIKPDNVLIDEQGRYLLCDFGISSKLRNTLRKSTESSKALTVAYSPPERFKGSGTAGPGGDVFALGVALYEMLSGELPWGGIGGVYLTPDSVAPVPPGDHSPELNQLVCSCMHYDPQRRPTAVQLYAAAEHYTRTGRWDAPTPPPVNVSRKTEPMPSIPPPPPGATMPQQPLPSYATGQSTMPGSAPSLDPRTAPVKSGNSNAAIWVVGAIVVVALAGAGVWRYMVSQRDKPLEGEALALFYRYMQEGDAQLETGNYDAARANYDSARELSPADTAISGRIIRLETARMLATLGAEVDTVATASIDNAYEEPVAEEVPQEQSNSQVAEGEQRLNGYVDSDGDTFNYVGGVRNGKPHGEGKATYTTGTVTYYDGLRNGRGKMLWDDGDSYDGEWRQGIRTGHGTYKWASGGKYVGDWLAAKMHGEGKYTWADGDTYTGDWDDNMMEGHGVFVVINGNVTNCDECKKYDGQWEDDKKVGWGKCYGADGTLLYEGSFSADAPTSTYPMVTRSNRIEPIR